MLLTATLFGLATGLLCAGLQLALHHEADEQLALRQRATSGRPLPTDLLFAYQLARRQPPRRPGFSNTLLLDERELVPYRQLTFPLATGRGPE